METEEINVIHRPLEDEQKKSFRRNIFELRGEDGIKREDAEMLKARIEGAKTLYQLHDQARSQISDEIMERKMDRDRVTSELKYRAYPRWHSYRNTIEQNNKAIKSLECALYDLDDPKQVIPLHYQMKHCCNTRAKERQLVREHKEAEAAARAKTVADAAVIPRRNRLSSKEDIENRIKCISTNKDGLKKNGLKARSKVEHLQRELEASENDIRRLQTQLAAVNLKKTLAYRSIIELERQRDP